jgi:hypothetical protein
MSNDNQKALSHISKDKLKPTIGGFSLLTEDDIYKQNYLVSRINQVSIEVTQEIRNFIEQAMGAGKKYVRVCEHTLMINSISGIDPMPKKHKLINLKGNYDR